MIKFSQFEAFKPVTGTHKKYSLDLPLVWDIGAKGSGWQLIIPPNTEFDISVPRRLEWMQDPHDRRVLPAAAIHDELLKLGHDEAFASSEFRRAAIARKVSRPWAWVLFFATLGWTVIKAKKRKVAV